MPSFNRIILIGRLTRDPELRYTQGGAPLATFTVAVDRFSKDPVTGEKKTDFFRCKAWRQTAEFMEKYVRQGRLVAVEGRVELNEYTGSDGQRRFSTDVVCDKVETLDRDLPGEAAPSGGYGGGQGGRPLQDEGGDSGYFPDEDPAPPRPAPSRPAPAPARPAAPAPAPRAAAPTRAAAPRPPAPAYPAEDDFDDSDPFADE